MPTHSVKLLRREKVAEGTMAFYFEKPSSLVFKPGQYLDCTLTHPPETDSEGNIRSFSIASAPAEPDLMLATRLRDTAFKRVLSTMPLGSELQIDGPMGSFTLHKNVSRPAVLLAGGIGITPFRSMIVHNSHNGLAPRIVLFYSNRRPEDATFLNELREMGSDNKMFRAVCVMTEMEKSNRPWKGETGYLDKDMLARYVPDFSAPIYYIAGPPAMVAATTEILKKIGINEDDVRAEDFAGY